MKPLLSVCCTSYNQEKHIQFAIEGFLLQKTSFPIEIIIHDDASTDKTADIIKSYHKKYPELIIPIYQIENKYSKGIRPLTNFVFKCAKGKYIALCEGDDYWTDPFKLQKQVDFLESNPTFSLIYHNVYFKNELDNTLKISDWPQKPELTIEDLALNNYIYTASVVFRRECLTVDSIPAQLPFGDYFMWLIIAQHGRIKYFEEPMGVYRIHEGGVWSLLSYAERQRKTLLGKKILMQYFKNDKIADSLTKSYIDLAFAAFLKIVKQGKILDSAYFLYCIVRMRKGRHFLLHKILRKL